MYYISNSDLIRELSKLPKDFKIHSIGTAYKGDKHYLTVSDENCKTIKEIELSYEENCDG